MAEDWSQAQGLAWLAAQAQTQAAQVAQGAQAQEQALLQAVASQPASTSAANWTAQWAEAMQFPNLVPGGAQSSQTPLMDAAAAPAWTSPGTAEMAAAMASMQPAWRQALPGGGGQIGNNMQQAAMAAMAAIQAGCAASKGKGKSTERPVHVQPLPRIETQDAIRVALDTAMQNVEAADLQSENEGAWDIDALKKRLASYFRKAAKGMKFDGEDYVKVINTYADAALSNVCWSLLGTKWLAKADFTLVVEVAIGELFPESFRENIPPEARFEDAILQAHDRALEEARFVPILNDVTKALISGKKAANKVINAAEEARRDIAAKMTDNQDDSADFFYATENGVFEKIQEFVKEWIAATVKKIGDWPESTLDQSTCQKLFDKLLSNKECCLPRALVRYMVEPLPEPWDFVATTCREIYAKVIATSAALMEESAAKRRKDHEGPNFLYKTEWCRNMMGKGHCRMGEWCVFAHDESEMWYGHKGFKSFKGGQVSSGKDGYSKDGCGKDSGKGYGKDHGKDYGGGDSGWHEVGGYEDGGYGKAGKDSWGKGHVVPPPKGMGKGMGMPYPDAGKGKGGGPSRPSSAADFQEAEWAGEEIVAQGGEWAAEEWAPAPQGW